MASLSAVIDRFSAPLFIIPDLKVAAYVSEHLEESTHQLIISFFFDPCFFVPPCISVVPTTAREFTTSDSIHSVFGPSLNIR